MKSAYYAGTIVGTLLCLLPILDVAVFVALRCYSVTGATGQPFNLLLWLLLVNAAALALACISIYCACKERKQNEARRIHSQN